MTVNEEVMLTVMVTCYNCVDLIDKAIASVVCQRLPFSWELLIGDDGSTDGTLEIVQEWARRYPESISVICASEINKAVNPGFRAALNRSRLLERARGRYLAFLDGDDMLLDENKYRKQIEMLEQPAYADCSCAAHPIAEVFADTKETQVQDCVRLKPQKIDPMTYWRHFYFHTNTIVFRRECSAAMLEPRYKTFLNDNFITYLLIQKGKIAFSSEVAAQYNRTGKGIWTGMSKAYGALRNVTLYDLEVEANPLFEEVAFLRHCRDFSFLLHQHGLNNDERITALMCEHPKDRFPTMWSLYDWSFENSKLPSKAFFALRTTLARAKRKSTPMGLVIAQLNRRSIAGMTS